MAGLAISLVKRRLKCFEAVKTVASGACLLEQMRYCLRNGATFGRCYSVVYNRRPGVSLLQNNKCAIHNPAAAGDAFALRRHHWYLLLHFSGFLQSCEKLGIRAASALSQISFSGGGRRSPELVGSGLAVVQENRMCLCRSVRLGT